jgi:hypothetical protein
MPFGSMLHLRHPLTRQPTIDAPMPRADPLATSSGQQPRGREFVSQLPERVFYASERRELNRTLMAVELPD